VPDERLAIPPAQGAAVDQRDVLALVALLPDEQRSVLLLVGVEELSYAEAANVLGVPQGTVMSRLSRARERLRRMVDDEQPAITSGLRIVR
jgi:RNA polymerase sigma-70 factor (ECF subfamily)